MLPVGCLNERNVRLSLGFHAVIALVASIAHGHIFTVYIYELFGNNAAVGLAESASGITSLVTAVPIGFAVDKLPRVKLLRFCACIGVLAALIGMLAVVLGPQAALGPLGERKQPGRSFTSLLITSLVLWGIFTNTSSSAVMALFTDSVPKGSQRQELYATQSTVTLLGIAAGPILALVFMVYFGNDWELQHMMRALLPGFILLPPACALLLFFEEVRLPAQDNLLSKPLLEDLEKQQATADAKYLSRRAKAVPYLLLGADLITSIGAGMTVKFFGLWFKNIFGFSPVGLTALQAVTPFAIAMAVQALQAVVRRSPFGPAPAVLLFWLTSIACLVAMTKTSDWRVLIVLHLLRTSLANCKEPVSRAIMADFIPSSQRGRWNSLHSLTSMTWNGSAVIGGILCDKYGYGRTFAFTAGLYLLAAVFWIPLIHWVPKEKVK